MKGLSLIEVLLAVGVSGLIGVLLVTILVNSLGLFYKQTSKVQGGLNINDALSQIRKDIKSSSRIIDSANLGGVVYTSGQTQLVLKLPSPDLSNNIIPDIFDYFVFFKDINKLRFKTFPDPSSIRKAQDQVFSTNTEGLLFEYFDSANPPSAVTPPNAAKVRITLTLKQKSGSDYEQVIATSEASLRND